MAVVLVAVVMLSIVPAVIAAQSAVTWRLATTMSWESSLSPETE
jgi:hypothetical protein